MPRAKAGGGAMNWSMQTTDLQTLTLRELCAQFGLQWAITQQYIFGINYHAGWASDGKSLHFMVTRCTSDVEVMRKLRLQILQAFRNET